MIEHHDAVGTDARAERHLILSADGAFAEAVGATLEREGRTVDRVTSRVEAETRLDGATYDVLVVDQHGVATDATAVVAAVRERDDGVAIVVCGASDAGTLASDALSAGAATFAVRDDPSRVASAAVAVVDAQRDAPTDRGDVYRTLAEDVLESSDVGFVVSDETGTVRWVTDAVGAFFDVSTDHLPGSPRRRLVRERISTSVTDSSMLSGHQLSPDGDDGLLVRTDQLETARWLDCRTGPVESGPFAGGRVDRFVDVTRFVRSEDGLRELQRLMVVPDVPFAERLHEVLQLGVERLDIPYGFVTTIDDGVQSVVDSVGDHDLLQPGESAPLLQTYCRTTLAAEGLVTIPDATDDGWANDPAYDLFELDTYIGAPIVVDGDTYGTLCFASSDPRGTFTDDEELFVEFAAAWTGWELERFDGAVS